MKAILEVLKFLKGDIRARTGKILISAGVALMCSGGIIGFRFRWDQQIGLSFEVSNHLGGLACIPLILGAISFILGVVLMIRLSFLFEREKRRKKATIFFFMGIKEMDETLPVYALPTEDRIGVTSIVSKKINSYNPDEVLDELSHIRRVITERNQHKDSTHGYIGAFGSVPYLFVVGTIFRNGHLPLNILERNRDKEKFEQLRDGGNKESVTYQFGGISGKDEVIKALSNTSRDEVGVSVSFTNTVNSSEVPEQIRNATVNIQLNKGTQFDALLSESAQEAIVKDELIHFLTSLFKNHSRVHLFLCAQISVVVRLGKLYQDNMMNTILVHNYNPDEKGYDWALEINRDSVQILTDSNFQQKDIT